MEATSMKVRVAAIRSRRNLRPQPEEEQHIMTELIPQDKIIKEERLNQLAATGRALSGRNSHPLLRYTKGEYWAGQREIALGTRVVALAGQARAEWHNFKTRNSLSVPIEQSLKLPPRAALGNTDPSRWELTADGEPRDPWVSQLAVDVLLEDTYTFASSSDGGQKAVGALVEDYAVAPEARQGRLPIVALESDAYPHKAYGRVNAPMLPIVDRSVGAPELLPALPRTAAELLDDDIPF
jgi:hypothetical protein